MFQDQNYSTEPLTPVSSNYETPKVALIFLITKSNEIMTILIYYDNRTNINFR